ncbi:hypothetical protein ZIOFF_043256 [Zingiber officinale]|uniref:Uncharacterized protein n=1 Tax=Zingiber officinale TaxID=94328 RepID=A0A8J5KW55_ZINOF|nr:hypothetical protein ZIOFF_043256 [Zingiber officinale]
MTQESSVKRAEELKEQIKKLFQETSDVSELMNLVDSIQLLGLDYHYEKEINVALSLISAADAKNFGLYETSLRFRLLRQYGFYLPADVFNRFKDEEGNFRSTLNEDVKGLLSLYNAAYLRIHGENILDEAISFTKKQLVSSLGKLEQPLLILVSLFLETPLCRRNRRLLTRKYIPIYQVDKSRNDAILELAKLDFNLLQSLHQEELKKISMWEPQAVDQVPEYLKDFYLKLLKTFREIENELESDEKYRISFLQDMIKALSRSFFTEAKWGIEKYVPTLEEHLSISLITTGYPVLICASYIGMGLVARKEAFEWVASFPKIIKASSLICRLMDDLNPSELEQERDLAASTIECFMKQYGMDEKETYKKLMDMLEDAWKDHNNEYLNSTLVPRLLIERAMNFSRAMEEFYKYTDTYSSSKTMMKDNISMVLVESVPI